MSLTSFIKASKDYRDLIRDNFVKPKFNAGPLIAEPQTLNYGLVGTAFDYLLRFKIERANECKKSPWVASKLKQFPLEGKINSEAQSLLKLYLKTGKMTNALMESAIKLATIDNVVRSGQGADQIGIVNPLDLIDLSNLYRLIDADKFKSNHSCDLNPTFGIGSDLVNGADADLIIDDALIDIKTTKKSDFTRPYFEQLIGYFLLHIIDCEDRNVPVSIKKLGIYFSRQGRLFLMDVADLIDESKLPNIISVFRDLLLISVPRKLSEEEKAKKTAALEVVLKTERERVRDLLSILDSRGLKTIKVVTPKVKSKAERKKENELRENELNDAKRSAYEQHEQSELEWIEPWNMARKVGERAIAANPSIKGSDLVKILDEEIIKYLVPSRSAPCELIWFGHKKNPSKILHEKSVCVARAIAAEFKKKHLSVAKKEPNKEKRKK